MSLAALPTALLIPPVNLVPLALGGMLLAHWYPRAGRRVTLLALLGLLVFAMPITPRLLMRGLAYGLSDPPATAPPPGAVVILSAGAQFGLPGGIVLGPDVDALTLDRLRAGVRLAKARDLPILVTGGLAGADHPSLGATMARVLARDFAITPRWVEGRSADTWQNAEFSAPLLRRAGISSVYLVSNGWHLRRAAIAFRHFGLTVTPAPTIVARWPGDTVDLFVPTALGLHRSYWVMHEWIGCAVYWLRDRLTG